MESYFVASHCAYHLIAQVNLEYLGRLVFNTDGILYPDSVVGTDSHTTMIDGLGVAGWGVGGIEAEAAMLGQVKNLALNIDKFLFCRAICDNPFQLLRYAETSA